MGSLSFGLGADNIADLETAADAALAPLLSDIITGIAFVANDQPRNSQKYQLAVTYTTGATAISTPFAIKIFSGRTAAEASANAAAYLAANPTYFFSGLFVQGLASAPRRALRFFALAVYNTSLVDGASHYAGSGSGGSSTLVATIAGLPAPSLVSKGSPAFVTDAYGGPTPAYSDGLAWRRTYDRALVYNGPNFSGRRMSMGIPNYSYPPGAWATYNALGMPDVFIQILNPDSGPGPSPDPGYVSAYAAALAKGTLILGYVPTTYGARPIADVKADIDKYFAFYPQVSGIFFDEMADENSPSPTDPIFLYYQALWNYVLTKPYPQQFVAFNPGATVAERFMGISSAIVLYEDEAANYLTHDNPPWLINYDRSRIWHLLHTVTSAGQMEQCFDYARELNVGTIFLTSDVLPNPWDTVSIYEPEQEARLATTGGPFTVVDAPGRASEWWASASNFSAVPLGVIDVALNNDPGASGYAVGNTFPFTGGTHTVLGTITVLAVDGLGGPTRVSWTPGNYTVAPTTAQDFGAGFKVNLTVAATNIITGNPDAAAIPNPLTASGDSRPFTVAGPGADVAARFAGSQKLYTPAPWHDQALQGNQRTVWAIVKTSLPDGVLLGGLSSEFAIYVAGGSCAVSYQAGSFVGGSVNIVGAWAIIVAVFDHTGGRFQLRVNGVIASLTDPGAGAPTTIALGDYADGGNAPTGNATQADIVAAGLYNRALTNTELSQLENYLSTRTTIPLG